jgi:hypothetical protein
LYIEGPYNRRLSNGSESFTLKVEVHVSTDAPAIVSISYSLDGGANVTFTNLRYTTWSPVPSPNNHNIYSIEENISNLSDGSHTLRVYSRDANGNEMSGLKEFPIDAHYKSPLLVLSPQNKTYTTTEVPLTFVCSEEITSADYQLDGIGEGPISGNLTLAELSDGDHTITVFVWTGKGAFSQTVYLSVTSEPDYFPASLAIAASAIIVVIGIGLFVYFKKRKH